MAHFTFRGGIELHEQKERTRNLPIEEVLPGKKLIFPLIHQEKPVVIPGEYVRVGQLIAKDEEAVERIHASVSGIVKPFEKYATAANGEALSIVIENDEKYTEADFGDFVEADDLENRQILARIMSAGITDTQNGTPVYRKLNIAEPHKIRHIIINCAESEPYLTSNYRCAVERPEWIIEGLRILLKLFPNAKGILAVHHGQQEAITALHKILADSRNIKIVSMKPKYPQDTERMLIYSCTGKKIHSGKTAEDARTIVINGDTAYAICNAVTFGKPMYRRLVTVSGECIQNPKNMEVCVGTRLSELAMKTGEYLETPNRLICGGPMTGKLIKDLDIPLTKEISAVLCLKDQRKVKASKKHQTSMCIGCGWCVDVCNENLIPAKLLEHALAGNREQFLKLGGMECCECGSCSFVCPSGRSLTQIIRMMKNQIKTEE